MSFGERGIASDSFWSFGSSDFGQLRLLQNKALADQCQVVRKRRCSGARTVENAHSRQPTTKTRDTNTPAIDKQQFERHV